MHVLGTPPAFILSQDQTLMLKFDVSSETFKILIRKKFSRSKWTWLSIFILLLNWVVRRIDADLSIAQIILTIQCPLNFLKIRHLLARSIKMRPLVMNRLSCSFVTSNIKEYIQGCISVLFSYKIGNVLRRPCKAGAHFQP